MQERRGPILGPVHLLTVAAVLLVTTLVLLSFYWPRLAEEYVLVVKAPALEERFGFHAEYIRVGRPGNEGRAYAITRLDPDGELSRAGFAVGDWLSSGVCRFSGDYVAAQAFLADLERVEAGENVEFTATRPSGPHPQFRRISIKGPIASQR